MSKQEQLQRVLSELRDEEVDDVQGGILASRDGLPICSTLEPAVSSRVAAMAATVLSLGSKVTETAGLGGFEEAVVQSDNGTFLVYDAGELAVLAVLARAGANLGFVHIEARRSAEVLAHMMASFREEAAARETAAAEREAHSDDDERPAGGAVNITDDDTQVAYRAVAGA